MSLIKARRMNLEYPHCPNWLEVPAEQFVDGDAQVISLAALEQIVHMVNEATIDTEMVVVTFRGNQ